MRLRRVGVDERRARLGVRHHLAEPARSVEDAVRSVVAVHSTDAASVVLGARARARGFAVADLERALYEDRSLARVLGMRRTMFVLPADDVPVVHAACTRALAPRARARLVRLVEDAGVAEDGAAWLSEVEAQTLAALEARGVATAAELRHDVPPLSTQVLVGEGKRWEGLIGLSTQVLFVLATEGRIIRGRPRGGWTSTQYRWAPLRAWLGVDVDALAPDTARAALARRWLRAFGPATVDDLRWWTGWTVAQTRSALAAVEPADVDLDGVPGIVLADDLEPPATPAPWVALLPALDSTVMGWAGRDWYLGPHRPALFDRNGNAGPTVWCSGRVVGGWAQRASGEIVVRLLEDVGAEATDAVRAAAAELEGWLGDVRFVPRFRTPLERELVR